jgi:hypothetical protein
MNKTLRHLLIVVGLILYVIGLIEKVNFRVGFTLSYLGTIAILAGTFKEGEET